MKSTKGDCVRLRLVRVLSYKLSKNHPHLTEFKDFIDSFQFEFYVVYFELIYSVCCLELLASQDFALIAYLINFKKIPCVIDRRVLTLSRY